MSQFENKSLNLVLLQIVGPVLIMLMVSSLVFFLIEVVYRGPHTARMYWVMGLFTIASVLVARISIEEGKERAMLFGLALALATLITSMQLVEFSLLAILRPVVLIGLITVVMWTSNKLTWDCTVVDKSRDVSSSGLWERLKRNWSDSSGEGKNDESLGKRIWHFFVSGSKANSPGTWVICFALVAFPIFGLGQWFVRPAASSWIYLLFALYFGSALGLLLTTSLLGLERYLARRNAHVPAPIARNWMLVGGAFALAVMLLVSLLPKPAGSSTFQDAFAALTSPLKKTSDWAQGKDGNEEKPDARNKKMDPNADQQDENGQDGQDPGQQEGDDGKGGGQGDAEGESDEKTQQDDSRDSSKPKKDQAQDNRQKPSEQRQDERNSRRQNKKQANENNRQQKAEPDDQNKQQRGDRQQQPPPQQNQQSNQPSTRQIFDEISKFVNWLVYLIGFIAAAVLLFLFRNELINLFNLLMGKRKKNAPALEETTVVPAPTKPPTPFDRFNNPFKSGGDQNSLRQLVNYTMLALEAWGREFGVERSEDETPHEFARRLKMIDPKVCKLAISLSDLYNLLAFSGKNKIQSDKQLLVDLWQRMEATYRSRQAKAATVA